MPLCLYQPYSYTRIIGNNTAVFIVPNSPVFPASDTNNTMLGFGYFQGGFILQDATTSCAFSSVFPVSGTINMNGGTLYLFEDLIITGTVQLQGLGRIIGNNHTIVFSESINSLPDNFTLIKDLNITFMHDVELNSTVTVQGNCHINCDGNSFSFAADSGLIIASSAQLEFQNTVLQNVGGNTTMLGESNIICIDNHGKLILNNSTLALGNNVVFAHGSINFKNSSALIGPYTFNYTSNVSSVIETLSTLLLDGGIEFKLGKTTTSTPEPLIFQDTSAVLSCNECTMHITNSGVQFTHGTLKFNDNTILTMDSSESAYGIIFGNSPVAADDFEVVFEAGCNTLLSTGAITYNNVSPDRFLNSATSSRLTVNVDITLYIATTCNLPSNTFVSEFNGTSFFTLICAPGQTLNANYTHILTPGFGDATYTGHYQAPEGSLAVYLDDNDAIYLSFGTPGNIIVRGSNNIIAGTGFIQTPLVLTSTNASVAMTLQGLFTGPLDLNGGTLALQTDFSLYSPALLSSGIIDLGSNTLYRNLPAGYTSFLTPVNFIGNLATISLQGDYTLSTTWTFDGSVTIDGNGNTLSLADGQIVINPSCQLTFKNVKLTDVINSSIICVDNTSAMVLDNSDIILAGNSDFNLGAVTIKNAVSLSGPYIFLYNSPVSSIIEANSTFLLTGGVEFRFGRTSPGGAEPIVFADKSSILDCNQCTLHITASGATLSRGALRFDGSVMLECDSTNTSYGLIFGDHTTADDDLQIVFGPGCLTTFQFGALTYNNINDDGFLNSAASSNFTLDPGVTFHLTSSCILPGNTFVVIEIPNLIINPGTALYFNGTHFSIPGVGSSIYNGYFQWPYNADLFFLDTNDSIFQSSGSIVVPTMVEGNPTSIGGVGSMTTPLLLAPGAVNLLSLQGSINTPVYLNGGTISLSANAVFTTPNCFASPGVISLNTQTCTLQPPAPSTYSVPVVWNGTSGTVQCTQDITLTTTWTFEGSVTLDLGGNALIFAGGALLVGPDCNLTIKNARLDNIVQSSINCTDDTGSITLYNTTWSQAGNYAFIQGALNYKGIVLMSGPSLQFSYLATQTSTINSDSTLTLDTLFTFIYAPSNNSTTLLNFSSFTSKLALTHSNFYIYPGLHLTKGQLTLQQAPTIYAFGDGLTLGDETITDSSADVVMIFLDASTTTIQAGSFNYQNLNPSSLQVFLAATLSFSATSSCKAYQTIDVGNIGRIIFYTGAQLYIKQAPGCPNTSDVIGDQIINKPTPINLC
jgi:acetyltransferase-like isoleucine patch superfamily enzyme